MASITLEQTNKVNYIEDTIRFPEEMGFVFDPDNDSGSTFERDALLLYPYIMQGRISNGRAAEILGVRKWNLVDWYESHGLMCLVTTVEDVEADLETLRDLREGVS